MTPGRGSALALLLLAQPPIQGPTFHAETDLVRLDVLVTRNGRPVSGLTADAFEVRDDGVTQKVLSVASIEAVYLGVALDVSGSMQGRRLEAVRRAFDALLAELGPDDRYAAVAFGEQVAPIGDSRDGRHEATDRFARIEAAGATSLIDAIYAGILQGDLGPGPKLLLVMTDGRNNGSWLRGKDVVGAARRHETVLYPVAVADDPAEARTRRPWLSHRPSREPDDSRALLRYLARETGGRVVESRWSDDLGGVFRSILLEFRQRYVLAFRPEGVGRGDRWHRLEVRLRRGKGEIRVRPAYWAGYARPQ